MPSSDAPRPSQLRQPAPIAVGWRAAMPPRVTATRHDEILVLEIDNPPVNALSPGVPEALSDAVAAAQQDAAVTAIVIRGAGRMFVAGADINELEEPRGATSGGARLARPVPADRGLPQAGGHGHSRHRARRRPRAGDGRPLSRRRGDGADRPARGESRHHPRRRRARSGCRARRRREGARHVRHGAADHGAGRARRWHRRRVEWRRSHGRRRGVRARVAGPARVIREDARPDRPPRHADSNAPLFGRRARAGRESEARIRRRRSRPSTRSKPRPRCRSTTAAAASASCSSSACAPNRPGR